MNARSSSAPWHDIDPDAEIPGWGQVSDLLAKVGSADIQRLDDAVLHAADLTAMVTRPRPTGRFRPAAARPHLAVPG